MRRGNILPIAIMVSAVAAFLVVGYFALPWKVFHQCPLIGIQCQPGTVRYDSRQCFKSCTPVSHSNTNSTTTTNTASNTNTSTNTNTVSTADWMTYTNYRYGYSFKFPTTVKEPYAICGGEGLEYGEPADICSQIAVLSGTSYNQIPDDTGVQFEIFDRGDIPLEKYVQQILVGASLIEKTTSAQLNNKTSYTAKFTGGLRSMPDVEGGFWNDAKTFVQFIPLQDSLVLRTTYPLEFCKTYKFNATTNTSLGYTVPCYTDDRSTLYGQMVSTLNPDIQSVNWKTYTNQDIRLTFSYPQNWGDVQVQKVDASMNVNQTGALVTAGSGMTISFTNGGPRMQASSSDFTQFMNTSYNGGQDLTKTCQYPGNVGTTSYCTLTTVANQETSDSVTYESPECSPNYVRQVQLNIPYGAYKGLTIRTRFSSDVSCVATESETQQIITSELVSLFTRKNLDSQELQNMRDFDSFLRTVTFTK